MFERALLAVAAAAAPTLLAYNDAPSPTFLNQALALGLWGVFAAATQPAWPSRSAAPLLAALALLMGSAVTSWQWGGLPSSLAMSALGLLLAAAVVAAAGAGARSRPLAEDTFAAFCWALAITGVCNVVLSVLQVFTPSLVGNGWVAASGIPGRAIGNLRQPNHLSSVLTWGCVALVGLVELRRLSARWAALALAAMVWAIVLTASRTGLLSVLLLALWGLADRRLQRPTRALLLGAPLAYALAWWGMAQWAAASAHSFGGAARLAETDISGSRFGIWANTLAMIRQQPWAGVGFGEFNFAWTLTPFPGRPIAFFDHTHNLPLQLAVELGLPLAALVMALLLWALARAALAAWWRQGPQAVGGLHAAQRVAVMLVLMIGLHSLLEYPLWYAYFLLPAAWAWGFALPPRNDAASARGPAPPPAPPPALALQGAALLLTAGAVFSVVDYHRVVVIFEAPSDASPLAERVARGQRSVFFAHHADYAAATADIPGMAGAARQAAFDGATHFLLDSRLMMAWSKFLAEQGRVDAARHVAARLREFRKSDAAEFLAECDATTSPAMPQASASAVPPTPPVWCPVPGLDSTVAWRSLLPARAAR